MKRWLLIVSFLGALGALAAACGNSGGAPQGPRAPDFTVRTSDGSEFTLSQARGRVVVLDFIIADCPSCGVEIPALARVYDEHRAQGLEVLVLDLGPSEPDSGLLRTKQRFGGGEHLWARDEGQRISQSYDVRSLGTTIVIDRQGRIAYRDSGATSYEKLKEQVTPLL